MRIGLLGVQDECMQPYYFQLACCIIYTDDALYDDAAVVVYLTSGKDGRKEMREESWIYSN